MVSLIDLSSIVEQAHLSNLQLLAANQFFPQQKASRLTRTLCPSV
jgi:hypothetical protein